LGGGNNLTRIVFATRNKGKLREIKEMLAGLNVILLSLNDFPNIHEIEEDGSSYLENALKKAMAVSEFTGEMALADDSGLEVDALGGNPGIHSSRYAGDDAADEDNMRKLLKELEGLPPDKRGATFHCELVFYLPGGAYEVFHGRWSGRINDVPLGNGGFGYDPVFFLPDRGITVGQLTADVKNRISHRAQAFAGFRERLQKF
jgi:XTP/dITP diphosphohydrolase